jgi:hypothetical protein
MTPDGHINYPLDTSRTQRTRFDNNSPSSLPNPPAKSNIHSTQLSKTGASKCDDATGRSYEFAVTFSIKRCLKIPRAQSDVQNDRLPPPQMEVEPQSSQVRGQGS